MSRFLPLLADRVLSRPLLIDPGKAEVILAVLEGRILHGFGSDGEGAAVAELAGLVPQPDASRFTGGRRGPVPSSAPARAPRSSRSMAPS